VPASPTPGWSSCGAQAVLGRNDIPWRTRIAIDLRYIDAWSPGLDARIVLQTLCMPLGLRPFSFSDLVADLAPPPP